MEDSLIGKKRFSLSSTAYSYIIGIVVTLTIAANLLVLGMITRNQSLAQNAGSAAVNSRVDTDQDGFKDYLEAGIGTDAGKQCGVNAWPPDVNNDSSVNAIDLSIVKRMESKNGESVFNKRFDMNVDGAIDATDLSIVSKYSSRKCDSKGQPVSDSSVGCVRADLNKDGLVNQTDLQLISEKFGTNDANADINGDGNVNAIDLSLVNQESFGKTCKADVSQLTGFAGNLPPCTSADVNKDSIVNSIDMSLVAQKFGESNSQYDVNSDKIINALDLHLVAYYFSQTCVTQTQAQAFTQAVAESAAPTKESCLKGDVNKDGNVNSIDQSLVTQNYGKKTGQGDANGDGTVNSIDMQIVFSSYGKKCSDLQSTSSSSSPTSTTQSSTASPSPTAKAKDCGLKGDINKDGTVNSLDMSQISQALNSGSKDTKYDVNGDGNVNSIDISQVSQNYGKTCS